MDAESGLLQFYRLRGTDHRGRTLADIRAFDADRLEDDRTTSSSGSSPCPSPAARIPHAPRLSPVDIAAFHAEPALREELRRSLAVMLRFYGLALAGTPRGPAASTGRATTPRAARRGCTGRTISCASAASCAPSPCWDAGTRRGRSSRSSRKSPGKTLRTSGPTPCATGVARSRRASSRPDTLAVTGTPADPTEPGTESRQRPEGAIPSRFPPGARATLFAPWTPRTTPAYALARRGSPLREAITAAYRMRRAGGDGAPSPRRDLRRRGPRPHPHPRRRARRPRPRGALGRLRRRRAHERVRPVVGGRHRAHVPRGGAAAHSRRADRRRASSATSSRAATGARTWAAAIPSS